MLTLRMAWVDVMLAGREVKLINAQCFNLLTGVTLVNKANMMTPSNRNIFLVTGLLCRVFTGHRWIHRAKASDAERWCFHWSAPEPTVEQALETPVTYDVIALIMTKLLWKYSYLVWSRKGHRHNPGTHMTLLLLKYRTYTGQHQHMKSVDGIGGPHEKVNIMWPICESRWF